MKFLGKEEMSDEEYKDLIDRMISDAKGLTLEAWSQADSGTSYLNFANREFKNGNIKEAIEHCVMAHQFLESALRLISGTSGLAKALKDKGE